MIEIYLLRCLSLLLAQTCPLLGGTFRSQQPRQLGTFLTQSSPSYLAFGSRTPLLLRHATRHRLRLAAARQLPREPAPDALPEPP
jgi:hypothetical protein